MTSAALRAKYEAMAADFARFGALVDGAKLAREFVADLVAVEHADGGKVLTLGEACAASGYSDRALRAMLADGRLTNVGRRNAPRIRADQLPHKPAKAAPAGAYSPAEDALQLARRGGPSAA